MKKNLTLLLFCCGMLLTAFSSCKKNNLKETPVQNNNVMAMTTAIAAATPSLPGWNLIFSDEFSSGSSFDDTKWSYCPRQTSDWSKYLTASANNVSISNDNLTLTMNNDIIPGDNVPYHAGGIWTSGKFNFTYGRVEVRAKFNQGQGSWPAIWLMPQTGTYGGWPNSGEIDIMEHLNFDSYFYATLHGQSLSNPRTFTNAYNINDYNIYAIEWYPSRIDFFVNGNKIGTYNNNYTGSAQWPFDKPFYLILNQSGGGSWGGAITDGHLPFVMNVDYVRVYQQAPNTDTIVSGATYKITTAMNGTSALDVNGAGTTDGTKTIIWNYGGGNNQKWKVTKLANGNYKLNPLHAPTKALNVNGSSSANGTAVNIWTDNGSTAQQWVLTNAGTNQYTMSPVCAPGKMMDVYGANTANGTNVIIWTTNNGNNQKWIFTKL